jgi:hypothetical protein
VFEPQWRLGLRDLKGYSAEMVMCVLRRACCFVCSRTLTRVGALARVWPARVRRTIVRTVRGTSCVCERTFFPSGVVF